MQLYSLIDPKGRQAREFFNLDTGSWVITDRWMAQRVQGWAREKGLVLDLEENNGRVALHCAAAGAYWHPEGVAMNYYLEHVTVLRTAIAQQGVAMQLAKGWMQSARDIDVHTIGMLLDELEEYFRDGISHSWDLLIAHPPCTYLARSHTSQKFTAAIPIARAALERLAKP